MIQPKNRICPNPNNISNCKVNFIGNTKLCSYCTEDKKKNLTVEKGTDGIKYPAKSFKSQKELDDVKKIKALEKAKKAKERAKLKRAEITEKKLDTIFSKLVRTIYDLNCKACGKPITFSTSHNAHLYSRVARCVRWDLRNCYNTCPNCNLNDQLHVIYLAKKQKEYYNIDIEDWINLIKQNTCKLNTSDRKILYDIFDSSYEEATKINSKQYNKTQSFELIFKIIEKTKMIL